MEPTDEQVTEERRKRRQVRLLVDLTAACLYQDVALGAGEARDMIRSLRGTVLALFPGCEAAFDLVIRPRLQRIVAERWGEAPHRC